MWWRPVLHAGRMDDRGQGLCKGGVRCELGVHRLGAERGVRWAALGARHRVPLPAAARGPREGPHPRCADRPRACATRCSRRSARWRRRRPFGSRPLASGPKTATPPSPSNRPTDRPAEPTGQPSLNTVLNHVNFPPVKLHPLPPACSKLGTHNHTFSIFGKRVFY